MTRTLLAATVVATVLLSCKTETTKPAAGEEKSAGAEQAVIVSFKYGLKTLDPLFDLEKRLETAIETAHAGEFDGNEISVDLSDGSLFMYGPDADRLFTVVRPILESAPFMAGGTATLRYGPAEDETARESKVVIAGKK